MLIDLDDPRLHWRGTSDVLRTGSARIPVRVPEALHGLLVSPAQPGILLRRARQAAGVRLALRTDSPHLALRTTVVDPGDPCFDVCVDGRLVGTHRADVDGWFELDDLPGRLCDVEIWFPPTSEVTVLALGLSDGATLVPTVGAQRRWTVYGSSITHCGGALSPTRTWPARVARSGDLDLYCLGLGGNARLEPVIARVIRDRPADAILLKVGINVYTSGSHGWTGFQSALLGFALTIRDGHPDTPMTMVSPIISPDREETPGEGGMTLVQVREEVAEAVDRLQAAGDRNLRYVDGRQLLGPEHVDRLPDGLHPDDEGYRIMAQNAVRLEVVGPSADGA